MESNYTAVQSNFSDHGTAYDIAGKGLDHNSFKAVYLALDIYRSRIE
jgi:4-hydroxy-L-threonine phosphate dehydrogenase PdxA